MSDRNETLGIIVTELARYMRDPQYAAAIDIADAQRLAEVEAAFERYVALLDTAYAESNAEMEAMFENLNRQSEART